MATKTSYSHARENLASLWDEVEDSREAAVIQGRGHEDMALVPADELASLRDHLPPPITRKRCALARGAHPGKTWPKEGNGPGNASPRARRVALSMPAKRARYAVLQDECLADLRFWVDTNRKTRCACWT